MQACVVMKCARSFFILSSSNEESQCLHWLRGRQHVGARPHLKGRAKARALATTLWVEQQARRSFFNVAMHFFACCSAAFGQNDIRIAAKPMLFSAVSAAQHSETCSATSVLRLWHVAGVGFRGVGGFRTC